MMRAYVRGLIFRLGMAGLPWVALIVAMCVPAPAVAQADAARAPLTVPAIPVERYRLDNGLTVLLSRDTGAAVVTVNVWYLVGSANESVGRTGYAHLFEHVMFQGSENVAAGEHVRLVEEAGGAFNASTNLDRSTYHNTVPAERLAQLLWLESDRMGFLLPSLAQDKLDREREAVRSERRERVENPPFGYQHHVISAAIYPAWHPYSWPTIGSMEDLSAATLEDARDFFRRWYVPGNAALAIVGDFDIAEARRLVAGYFGGIPAGSAPGRPKVEPVRLGAEKRLVLEDSRARLPLLTFAWPTVGVKHADVHALTALTRVLTQDRSSRLTRLLVHERDLATSVNAYQGSDAEAGELYVYVTPRQGASLTEIERLVDSVITGLVEAPPTEPELQRHRNFLVVRAVTGLQSSFARSEALLQGELFHGDPQHHRAATLAALSVVPADVRRVARDYLTGGRVVLSMVPEGRLDLISKPEVPFTRVTPAGERP